MYSDFVQTDWKRRCEKTAEISFDEIMEYHKENRSSFDSLCRSFSQVLPFIGAGLSAFAYPCWRGFLCTSAQNLNENGRGAFFELLGKRDYARAASLLEKERGAKKFRSDIKEAFCDKRLYEPEMLPVMRDQAAYLLPELFTGLVLTTNFDRTLERVYELRGSPFRQIGHPGNARMLCRALQKQNAATLFKFHGDLARARSLVLTKERYDRCYRADGALAQAMRSCFCEKNMLFLGCSLYRDRTMDILQGVLQNGTEHFAVLNCEKERLGERARALRGSGILPVFYPPRRHEAVRVVLRQLLRTVKGDSI